MSENRQIISKKLEYLHKMRADIDHSTRKMVVPLEKIQHGDIDQLSLDDRETVSAFTKRFGDYQEHLGKLMRSVAIEEESDLNPFGAILALMEKLGVLESAEQWRLIRELRNQSNHEYEDNAAKLVLVLRNMVESVAFLKRTHSGIQNFADSNYQIS